MLHFICRAWCVFTLAWLLFAHPLRAQSQLTTIEDVIYRADGTRFDGTALIEWRSFQTSDYRSVAAYNKSVRIINGLMKVSLFPTTNASSGAHYQVRYVSGGRIQSFEYWGVPPSSTVLKLKDIRLIGPPLAGAYNSPASGPASVTIPDVTGLNDELGARPKKGIGFAPSHAAVINSTGDIEAAAGDPTDCVRVDGSTSACAVVNAPDYFDNETPAGLINGTNATFTLANAPQPVGSLQLYRNGLLLRTGTDYSVTANTIHFLTGAVPQTGDLLTASYRVAVTAGQTGGQAGGALAGYFPAPSIAAGAIADQHIASNAAIQESKLLLNYPTHSSANDPTPEQKAGMQGTSGAPSNTNRFVTDQDSRLSNARTPAGHPLLGGVHSDTNLGTAVRGDIIVGVGMAPTLWSRIPLGAANRCLISNGFDAVWNSCLYTGFPTGSVPFMDGGGNLAHNSSRLFWDNSARRLAIGTNSPTTTVTIHDAAVGDGVTGLTVRAGDAQSSNPLQKWQSVMGADLAKVEVDGVIQAAAIRPSSSATGAAWRETGTPVDPSTPANGNAWFHSAENARKTYESNQVHVLPQIVCSKSGSSTSNTSATSLGKCRVPLALLRAGDRFEVRVELSHQGSSSAFSYSINWGNAILTARSGAGADAQFSTRLDTLPNGATLYWGWQSWGSATGALAGTGLSTSLALIDTDVEVFGQMATSTSDAVTLQNLTVIRLPGLANP